MSVFFPPAFLRQSLISALIPALFSIPAAPTLSAASQRLFNVGGQHAVWSPARARIYIAATRSVQVLNPEARALEATFSQPNQPNRLAVTEDGAGLYVYSSENSTIRRLHLPDGAEEFKLSAPFFNGCNYIDDIQALPGSSNAFAVLACSTIAIFDGEQFKPETAAIPLAATPITGFRFYSNDTILAGGAGLLRFRLSAQGVTLDAQSRAPAPAGGNLVFEAGRVFTGKGTVWDPRTLELTGSIIAPIQSTDWSSSISVAARPGAGEIWYGINSLYRSIGLASVDAATLQPRRQSPVQASTAPIFAWGADGWAMVDSSATEIWTDADISPLPAQNLQVLSTPSGIRRLPLPHSALLGDPERGRVYVAITNRFDQAGNAVLVLDGRTGDLIQSFAAGLAVRSLAYSQDGRAIHALGLGGFVLASFDRDSLAPIDSWTLPMAYASVAAREVPLHPGLFVASFSTSLYLLDRSSNTRLATSLDYSAAGFAFSSDGSMIFAKARDKDVGAAVGPAGLTASLDLQPGLHLTGGPFTTARGLVFSAQGAAWQQATGRLAGLFSPAYAVLASEAAPVFYTVQGGYLLRAWSSETFSESGRVQLPLLSGATTAAALDMGAPDTLVVSDSTNLYWVPTAALVAPEPFSVKPAIVSDYVQSLPLQVSSLLTADDAGHLLVSSYSGLPCSLALLDPASGAILSCFSSSRRPGAIARSAAGDFAYFASSDQQVLARLKLPGLELDRLLPYPAGTTLAVDPANPLRVASAVNSVNSPSVSDESSTRSFPIGPVRPDCGFLRFAEQPGILDCLTPNDFIQFKIEDSSLSLHRTFAGLMGNSALNFSGSGPFAAASNGIVVDLSTGARLAALGSTGPIHIDPALNRFYQLRAPGNVTSSYTLELAVFDLSSGTQLGRMTVPAPKTGSIAMPGATALVAAGPGRLAARTFDSILILSLDGLEWSSAPARSAEPVTAGVRALSISAGGLAWDSSQNRLLAAITAETPIDGNQLAAIDPSEGSYTPLGSLGPNPGPIALSSDGAALYAAHSSGGSVTRFHLPSLTPGPSYHPGADTLGAHSVRDLAVLPGNPDRLLVLKGYQSSYFYSRAVDLVENGVLLDSAPVRSAHSLAAAPSGSSFYVSDGPSLLTEYSIEDGVRLRLARTTAAWNSNSSHQPLKTHLLDGRAYRAPGFAVDLDDLGPAGRFSIPGARTDSPIECLPVAAANRCYCTLLSSGALSLHAFELDTWRFIGSLSIPGSYSSIRAFESAGPQSLALATPGRLLLIDPSVFPAEPPASDHPVSRPYPGVTRIALTASGLWWDEAGARLLATVPGSQGQHGNRLVSISPSSGDVTPGPSLGSDPSRIIASADASRLFVALDGAHRLCRLELPALLPAGCSRLLLAGASGQPGWTAAFDLAAVPGAPDSVFVSLKPVYLGSPHVAVFDGPIARPSILTTSQEAYLAVGDGDRLYASPANSTYEGPLRYRWMEEGLQDQTLPAPGAGPTSGRLLFSAGTLYATGTGIVLDADATRLRGFLYPGSGQNPKFFFPSNSPNRLWVLSNGATIQGVPFLRFSAVDLSSLALIDYSAIYTPQFETLQAATPCGPDCLAAATAAGTVYLLHPSQLLPNLK